MTVFLCRTFKHLLEQIKIWDWCFCFTGRRAQLSVICAAQEYKEGDKLFNLRSTFRATQLKNGFMERFPIEGEGQQNLGHPEMYVSGPTSDPMHLASSFQQRQLILKINWHRTFQHVESCISLPSSLNYCFVQASLKMTAPSPSFSAY